MSHRDDVALEILKHIIIGGRGGGPTGPDEAETVRELFNELIGPHPRSNSPRSKPSRSTRRFPLPPTEKKRRKSAYNVRYGKAFKRLAPKYKKKNGSWKKDGFKRCAAAARKEAKK